MLEFNLDLSLHRQFMAEALCSSQEAEVFELRRMQAMGERLNILTKVNQSFAGSLDEILYTRPCASSVRVVLRKFNGD